MSRITLGSIFSSLKPLIILYLRKDGLGVSVKSSYPPAIPLTFTRVFGSTCISSLTAALPKGYNFSILAKMSYLRNMPTIRFR